MAIVPTQNTVLGFYSPLSYKMAQWVLATRSTRFEAALALSE
jgi:hypothetical protein